MVSLFQTGGYPVTKDYIKFQVAKEDFIKGMKFFNKMQYLAAAEFFRNAVKEYPDYHTARDFLARSYKLAGYMDEAVKELQNFQEIAPDNLSIASRLEMFKYRDSDMAGGMNVTGLILNDMIDSAAMKSYNFANPVDIAVDKDKKVYITSFSSGRLVVIDHNGAGAGTFKPELNSQLYGLDYYNGSIAVTDSKFDRVYLLDQGLKIKFKFGGPGKGEGEFYGPHGICFDDRGNMYVVDSGNHRVQKFDDAGKFILQFGEKGEYEKQLSNPTDIVYSKNRLYVTDTDNKRIAAYDDSGNFIENITVEGLEKPRGISLSTNRLMISDEKSGLIFYDVEEKTSRAFYSFKGRKNRFNRLMSSVFDRDGYLYCLDYGYESVLQFSPVEKKYSGIDIEITSVDTERFPAVAFYINVRGRDGKPIYNLDRENFMLTEDKARMRNFSIDYLKKASGSASMVLCVDRSLSNEPYHGDIPWAADFILKKMRKNDSLKLVNFNSDYWEANKFDWSRRRTLKALGDMMYGEDETGRKKKVYAAGKRLDKVLYNAVTDLAPRLNRRGVILITDGTVEDNSFQQYAPGNIIHYARSHYIPIYIISYKKPHYILETIAAETGGMILRPGELDRMGSIYDHIRQSEEYRYVLVYTTFKPQTFRGWWSDVKIEVDYKKQKGIEWGGYFVP